MDTGLHDKDQRPIRVGDTLREDSDGYRVVRPAEPRPIPIWVSILLGFVLWLYIGVVLSSLFGEKAAGIWTLATIVPPVLWVSWKYAQNEEKMRQEYAAWCADRAARFKNEPNVDLSWHLFYVEREAKERHESI